MRDSDEENKHPELSGSYQGPGTMPENVSDLLTRAQLDNARDVYKLIGSRSELSPYQDRELAVKIVSRLVDYHDTIISKQIEEGNASSVVNWAIDLQRLNLVVQLLESVDLSDD